MMDISNCTKSTGSLALCYAWMPWWVQRIPLHARSICRFKYFTMQIKINTTSMIVWNHWLATAEQSSSAIALFKHIFWLHCIIFGSVVSLFESNAYYMNLHCKKKFPENRKIPHIYNQRDRSKLNISFFC